MIWQKHFEYPPVTEGRGFAPAIRCAPAARPPRRSSDPPTHRAARQFMPWRVTAKCTPSMSPMAKSRPPFKFGFGNGKSYALNMWNDILFTTTSQGCNGNPNQMWAMRINDPKTK